MAAISSVQHNPELHEYYQRKVQEGKNKMSAINAVRNKLLHRRRNPNVLSGDETLSLHP
jgi:transposase